MFGPHCGTGKLAVADWWLGMACVVEDETEAAAAPAKTTARAKTRRICFMVGNPLQFGLTGKASSRTLKGYRITTHKSRLFIEINNQ